MKETDRKNKEPYQRPKVVSHKVVFMTNAFATSMIFMPRPPPDKPPEQP